MSINAHWDWVRRWIPAEEASHPWQGNSHSLSLNLLSDIRVLVLVGDPGSGKTNELSKERARIESEEAHSQVLYFDSKNGISSDTAFIHLWFESTCWESWLASTGILYVFVDGLDEFIHRIPGVAEIILQVLEDKLRFNPEAKRRLRIRVGSRTIALPEDFVSRLRSILYIEEVPSHTGSEVQDQKAEQPKTNLAYPGPIIFSLSPLSNEEIVYAAESLGFDGQAFIAELENRGFMALARRPKSLKFLLWLYSITGSIEGTYDEIYWSGLSQLIADDSTVSDPNSVLNSVARIAFVMVFSKTDYLQVGTTPYLNSDEPLSLSAFLEPRVSHTNEFFPFTTEYLESIPSLDLFTGMRDQFTWSELPDMEFLAAKYADTCGLPTMQLLDLLTNSDDPRMQVVPELSNIASHLSALNNDVFSAILKLDPRLLIRADSALQDDLSRHKVVAAILQAYEAGELIKSQWYSRDYFSMLAFEGIADVLDPYISDSSLLRITREMAIDIARDCRVTELVPALGAVANSNSELEVLRRDAVVALYELGTEEAIDQLSHLLVKMPTSDEFDELKGWALRAVWPDRWSLDEILPLITPPKSMVFGSYRMFLLQSFVDDARVADLPSIYDWFEQQSAWDDEMRILDSIGESLVQRAVSSIPEPSAIRFVASKMIAPGELNLYKESHYLESSLLASAANSIISRRTLVEHLIILNAHRDEQLGNVINAAVDLYQLLPSNRRNEDIGWIVERATSETAPAVLKTAWFRLLRAFQFVFSNEDMELVYSLYLEVPHKDQLAEIFDPIEITGTKAESLRYSWDLFGPGISQKEMAKDKRWFADALATILTQYPEESIDRWYNFDNLLRRTPDNRVWQGTYSSRPSELENWNLLTPEDLNMFISAAIIYLRAFQPNCTSIGVNEYYYVDQAAYRAMTLLLEYSDTKLTILDAEDWRRLGPVLFSMPPRSSNDPPAFLNELLQLAIVHGFGWEPWLESLLKANDPSGYHYVPIIQVVAEILDEPQLDEYLGSVFASDFPISAKYIVGSVAGKKNPGLVADHLLSLAEDFSLSLTDRVQLVTTAFEYFHEQHWQRFTNIFDRDEELFVSVFLHHANWERSPTGFGEKLNEQQVANLYARLVAVFPPREDINVLGVHEVTPREMVGRWREDLLDHLANRGTWKAVEELKNLATRISDVEWLPVRVAQAEDLARQRTWIPHLVEDLLLVIPSTGARIVRSEDQLQAVIVESLQRLNQELQGASPSAIELWTTNSGETAGVPKNEETLSDYIKRFLDRDLHNIPIFNNREVNNTPLQRNDILIECAAAGSSKKLSVICEVKGCWNPDIRNNMKTQLVDQYLKSNGTKHGVFVVGFFDTDSWPPAPKRNAHRERWHTIESVRANLIEQADTIRSAGYSVIPVVLDCRLPWDISVKS